MLIRSLTLASLLLATLGSHHLRARSTNTDGSIVRGAARLLGHQSDAKVVRWLSHQFAVRQAMVGPDGRSMEITFRDGARSVVLSTVLESERLTGRQMLSHLTPAVRQVASESARALVLEPFESELHLPSGAGSGEASALTAAGFRVDGPVTDTAVTPTTLSTLAQYNVVYMHTHTGVDQNGAGVLATGEPASCSPYVSPDGTVATVGVAGSTQCFHAITAAFIRKQVGQFPSNALVYVNGCDLLDAADFLQVFAEHGVGVTLSWNGEATGFDGYLSSLALFNQLGQGATVSHALTTLYANHYGTSQVQGHTATLGFSGNGDITLQTAAAGGPGVGVMPTVTAVASATPVPTATALRSTPTVGTSSTSVPTATRTPTETPTRVPVPATPTPTSSAVPSPTTGPKPAIVSVIASVKPGRRQSVTVVNAMPGSADSLSVQFPNGDRLQMSGSVDASGAATISFTQAASKITRRDQTADLKVMGMGVSGPFVLHAAYHIGFGAIDVSVQPRILSAGHVMTAWIHAGRYANVAVLIKLPHARIVRLHGRTGAQGWLVVTDRLPRTLHHGDRVVVRADSRAGSIQWHSATTVRIA